MKKRIGLLVTVALLVLTLGACGDKEPSDDKSDSQTKTESSSVADKESKEEKKEEKDASQDYNLKQDGNMGPYKYLYPEGVSYKPTAHGKTFGPFDGYLVATCSPVYGLEEYYDFDASTLDVFIESSKEFLKEDLKSVRGDIFGGHFDIKFFYNVSSTEEADIDGFDAYIVRGVVGDETYEKDTYFVACYVMDEKAPFYLFGVPYWENPGPEEGLADYLKAIVKTIEWNE